jgi:hypothetical protein
MNVVRHEAVLNDVVIILVRLVERMAGDAKKIKERERAWGWV